MSHEAGPVNPTRHSTALRNDDAILAFLITFISQSNRNVKKKNGKFENSSLPAVVNRCCCAQDTTRQWLDLISYLYNSLGLSWFVCTAAMRATLATAQYSPVDDMTERFEIICTCH